ncbi:MAG: hypothetical protein EAZ53_00495 [Bacteroidetes bacterium]|nr:MAG: hypothetical protein EAZ53_00495 [Bacteroidota bacterium]
MKNTIQSILKYLWLDSNKKAKLYFGIIFILYCTLAGYFFVGGNIKSLWYILSVYVIKIMSIIAWLSLINFTFTKLKDRNNLILLFDILIFIILSYITYSIMKFEFRINE